MISSSEYKNPHRHKRKVTQVKITTSKKKKKKKSVEDIMEGN